MKSAAKTGILAAGYRDFLKAMMLLSLFGAVLLTTRVFSADNQRFVFLFWNLVLAWLPAIVSLWFVRRRDAKHWQTGVLFFIWLMFLPNTFYVLSDFIHLRSLGDIGILYDVVLLFVFSSIGFLLGLASLGVMHTWLKRYATPQWAAGVIYAVIFLCSFAIYLGRYLRWNSWDVLLNPFGLLVDVSDRIINPLDNPRTLSTTLLFFALIGTSYTAAWWLADSIRKHLPRR